MFTLRPHQLPDDLDQLVDMNILLIRDQEHRNEMSRDELTARMRGWLESGEYQALLFMEDQQVVGYTLFREEDKAFWVRQFYIYAAFRRQGYGRKSMDMLMNTVWKKKPRIRLEVLWDNRAAQEFYRSLGFSEYAMVMEYQE